MGVHRNTAIEKFLSEQGRPTSDNVLMIKDPDIISLIQKEVDSTMEKFSHYERVKKIALLNRLFTIDNGELTPTLKVIRKAVLENFSDEVAKIYDGSIESIEQEEAAIV